LPFVQELIVPRGWAMECRITSEDFQNGFLPSTGRVTALQLPSGPGVRWDGGIEVGSEVGLFYDPMLAKLIVHAGTRDAAIARMHRALLELEIEGVETSREFHLRMMQDSEFRSGDITIQWLEAKLPTLSAIPADGDDVRVAAIAAALVADRDRNATRPDAAAAPAATAATDAWRRAARLDGLRLA
jgi:acetyl-CoA carboxylase, biotin carboxylase subunit